MNNGIKLFNLMRENSSATYLERVPQATQQNLGRIGDILLNFDGQVLRNEFTGMLVKVALTLYTQRMYSNKFKFLKKGKLANGLTIEEITFELTKAMTFDNDGKNSKAPKRPKILPSYYNNEFKETYKTTISRSQIRTAFSSDATLSSFFTNTINAIYNAYETDDELKIKHIFGMIPPLGKVIQIERQKLDREFNSSDPNSEDIKKSFALEFISRLKNASKAMTYNTNEYTPYGNVNHTPIENQVLVIDYRLASLISTYAFSSAFNKNEIGYVTKIIEIDSFSRFIENEEKEQLVAVLCDERACMFYDLDVFTEEDHNGEGAFNNIYLHVHSNYAFSGAYPLISFILYDKDSTFDDLTNMTAPFTAPTTLNAYVLSNSEYVGNEDEYGSSIHNIYTNTGSYIFNYYNKNGEKITPKSVSIVVENIDGVKETLTNTTPSSTYKFTDTSTLNLVDNKKTKYIKNITFTSITV